MSPNPHGPMLRSSVATGILMLAALGAPSPAHAQTGYAARALLNRVPLSSVAPTPHRSYLAGAASVRANAVNGERALLGRWSKGGRP